MDTEEGFQDIAGSEDSKGLRLHKLRSAVDNAMESLRKASSLIDSFVEEGANPFDLEDNDD